MRIFQRQHVRQRDQRAHTLDLFQQRSLRITLLRQIFDALVVLANLFTEDSMPPATAPARFVVPDSVLPLSPDSCCARCSRAIVRRKTSPVHVPCSPAPSALAPVRRAPGSTSDLPAPSHCDASPDSATGDRSSPAAPGCASMRSSSCGSPRSAAPCAHGHDHFMPQLA